MRFVANLLDMSRIEGAGSRSIAIWFPSPMRQARGPIGPAAQRVEVEGVVMDFDKRLVTRDGAPIKLTPKEYDLLAVLFRNAGRVVTHRQILASVWGPAHHEDTQYLRVFIGQLRAKIERDPTTPTIVKTEPGVGYRAAEP